MLGHMFNLLRNCQTIWLHHFTSPPAMYEASSILISSPRPVIIHLFDYSHPSGCGVITHCGLTSSSLMTNNVECLFSFSLINLFIYLFIFGCVGSLLLPTGFL